MTKTKFLIQLSFNNKNDEEEIYEDERTEWDMFVAVGRTLRESRQTILKGRRDVKELTINVSKIYE